MAVGTHKCNALACEIQILREHWMCKKHFAIIPFKLRMFIMGLFREGDYGDKEPTDQFKLASTQAISLVARYELTPKGSQKLKIEDNRRVISVRDTIRMIKR